MLSALRQRLTYANVVSSICLFLVLSGGTAIALKGRNSVKADDLAPNAVRSIKVKNNTMLGVDVKESSLGIVPNANKLDGQDSSAFGRSFGGLSEDDDATQSFVLRAGPMGVEVYDDATGDSADFHVRNIRSSGVLALAPNSDPDAPGNLTVAAGNISSELDANLGPWYVSDASGRVLTIQCHVGAVVGSDNVRCAAYMAG